MATVKDIREWIVRDITRCKIQIVALGSSEEKKIFKAVIYTHSNEYHISAREDADPTYDKGYLGCIASSRCKRAGEHWHRGNDLPDGSLNQATWYKILSGIVRYEAQRISSQCEDNENENQPPNWGKIADETEEELDQDESKSL